MRTTLITLVVLAGASTARPQSTLLSIGSPIAGQAAIGSDLDGDRIAELWIGVPLAGPDLPGTVGVHSGADGSLLATWVGEAPADRFGSAVSVVGDLDQDGVLDVAVGAIGATADPLHRPYVQVRSGVDGTLLWRAEGPARDSAYGAACEGLGDVDGDGVPDVALAASGALGYPATPEPAFAEVRSGATGVVLWRTDATSFGGVPVALARYDDLDGDGASELAAGFPTEQHVLICSGASGAMLMQLEPPPGAGFGYGTGFGAALDARGDFDGDGRTELLIGAPFEAISPNDGGPTYEGVLHHGSVYVLSGAALDGPPLFRVTANSNESGFGSSVASIGDSSGDGVPDFVTGNKLRRSGCCNFYPGEARVFSGSDGALVPTGFVGNGDYEAAGDWNGDGLTDYLVTRPTGGVDYTGVTEIVAGSRPWPTWSYDCAGTAHDCYIVGGTTGTPSASSIEPFGLFAGEALQSLGAFLLLGEDERFAPFGHGTLCIARPFARRFALAESTGFFCPLRFTCTFAPGELGTGHLTPGRTVFGQFFILGTGGPGDIGTSASVRFEIWP